ncbi:MAG: hypothetical protein EHM31_00150 [Candidatus Aminicenantes bacterium]|nr:MAG: hypothetical protein EHM31_00150 [Candidatus Aminicenantes bacterium]
MRGLTVGYGERIVTPPLGVDLAGYGFYLDRKAESVLDDLKCRAVHVKADGRSLLLVSCDVIGFTVDDADAIRAAVAAAHGIPREAVLLAATHTHCGPAMRPMPGLGDIDPAYMRRLRALILEAAAEAVSSPRPAEFSYALEAIEPLGYNRRRKDFSGVDPVLKAAIFKTRDRKVYLLSYACHAVVFGRKSHVSADWPGAVVREIEKSGDRAVFFQGFCGDIDPVIQMNRWGEGTAGDLLDIADFVRRRLARAERFAVPQPDPGLAACEHRITVPLTVYDKRTIERQAASFEKTYSQFPGAARFAADWRERALAAAPAMRKAPAIGNVPVQALAIGGLKLVALPGEIFSEIGLKLRKTDDPLMPVGYANGDIGYVPTDKDFRDAADYACYCAPMFYELFPFRAGVERLFLKAGRKALRSI